MAWSALILFLAPAALAIAGIAGWQWLAKAGALPAGQGKGLLAAAVLVSVWYVAVMWIDRRVRARGGRLPSIVERPQP